MQNGGVKRYNQILLKSIHLIHTKGKYWQSYFNSILLDYCSKKYATTQISPDMLIINRDI